MLTKTKKKMKLPFFETIGFTVLVIFASGFLSSAKPATQEIEVGICAECHEDVCVDFKLAHHGEIKEKRWTDIAH